MANNQDHGGQKSGQSNKSQPQQGGGMHRDEGQHVRQQQQGGRGPQPGEPRSDNDKTGNDRDDE